MPVKPFSIPDRSKAAGLPGKNGSGHSWKRGFQQQESGRGEKTARGAPG